MAWLDGKVAVITGAGAGIGKAVAQRFLEEGVAGIVAFDIYEDRLAALQRELGGDGLVPLLDAGRAPDGPYAVFPLIEMLWVRSPTSAHSVSVRP